MVEAGRVREVHWLRAVVESLQKAILGVPEDGKLAVAVVMKEPYHFTPRTIA